MIIGIATPDGIVGRDTSTLKRGGTVGESHRVVARTRHRYEVLDPIALVADCQLPVKIGTDALVAVLIHLNVYLIYSRLDSFLGDNDILIVQTIDTAVCI